MGAMQDEQRNLRRTTACLAVTAGIEAETSVTVLPAKTYEHDELQL